MANKKKNGTVVKGNKIQVGTRTWPMVKRVSNGWEYIKKGGPKVGEVVKFIMAHKPNGVKNGKICNELCAELA